MARGKVSQWNGSIGRITDAADGAQVFFGNRALRGLRPGDVQLGMEVEFERVQNDRGPAARNVRRPGTEGSPPQPPAPTRGDRPWPRGAAPTPIATRNNVPIPPDVPPLPASLRRILQSFPATARHPGLQLDKYSRGGDQTVQKEALAQVVAAGGDSTLFGDWHRRRDESLQTLGARAWRRTTAGPLTLHLARASALENAGICLHPVYGFAYLPGTGLKGTARAYAETVWLSSQADPGNAWQTIEKVFGWAPGSDVLGKGVVKPWKPEGAPKHGKDDAAAAGEIVFHDAWPSAWPQLIVDIVNNHHPSYYQNGEPPGDWDSPNPVYFLAVPAGQEFSFALAKRRADVSDGLLGLAEEWLNGALTVLGCGAKTVVGYGYFRGARPASAARLPFEATLELATPAFLAGANPQGSQAKQDCDLRPATLRGLLRWWWRAMHAGFVDVLALRRLEAALWGDTAGGSAVTVQVLPIGKPAPVAYDKQAEARTNCLPAPPDRKTTQGLWYHSYGMHDGGKQRHYLPPGTKWKVVLGARDGRFVLTDRGGKPILASARRIDKTVVLDQARAALWWLCMVGGVGSKARKGFGAFQFPPELQGFPGGSFVTKGKELRAACGLTEDGFRAERADGPAIRQMVDLGRRIQSGDGWVQVSVPTVNVWQAIDRVGMTAQTFAKRYRHRMEKKALGLPRRVGSPTQGNFRPGPGVNDRHASPVHYHLHKEGNEFVLRVAAFPATRLPNLADSEAMLSELLRHFLEAFPT